MTMTVYMQPMEGLVARGRRTDGPSRLVPVDGLWECRCRVGVVKPHASADRTADTTRGDTVPWESQTLAERGKCEIKPYALERYHLSDSQLSASTTRDPRYVLCTGKELVPRGEQWSVPPWGQGTRHRTRAHDSQDPGRCQVPAEQLLCCRVYRVLALSPIL